MRPVLIQSRAVGKRVLRSRALLAPAASLVGDGFSGSSTAPNAWLAVGNACLTAGTNATPATSIPACGANAPQDPSGQGALELTSGTQYQSGMVVAATPVSTRTGLQVTFTDYSFNGSTPGADGITLFLSDASQAMPTAIGALGGSLGYANGQQNGPAGGIANGYVGIAFDEYGNFSNPTEGRSGGPGSIPETLAVRGAASSGYQYIGGATNAQGQPASLPFSLDAPSVANRPTNAPTVQMTLTPAGLLTVLIDRNDGNGLVQYYSQTIVGANGQPAVPANVYVGLTGSTGGSFNRHQIGSFSVAAISATPQGFTPTQIPNLQAWFDASNPLGVTQTAGAVSAWNDLSGNKNTVSQATPALEPLFAAAGINNLGTLTFNGKPYLVGSNASFSSNLFNESTVFVVSNQANSTQSSSVAWAGAYYSSPRWNLRLSENGVSNFDFNNYGTGRLSPHDVPNGPAVWTAAGSVSNKSQVVRKDGNTLSSSGGPGSSATGAYPLAIGAMISKTAATYRYNGQLGEILMFNRFLSSAETTQVEGYLACKWGLQNRLPANHPYRTVCPQGGTHPPLPLPAPVGNALSDPQQLRSQNGQLTFNVVASQNATSGSPQFTYNGANVPPTLRLLPGDTLIVNLTNNLPTPPSGAGYLNDTNLHYHGLHVTPNAPGDDSIDMLAMPGQTLHYQIAIPTNHPTGLYWYHSHAHGEAERQNLSGMSGALIIDGVSQYVPQVANMPERVLIARDVLPAGQVLPAADKNQVRAMFWAMQHGSHAAAPAAMHGMPMRGMAMHGMSMDTPVRGSTTAKTRNPFVVVDAKYRRFVRPAASTHCVAGETAVKNWTLNGQTNPSIGIRPGEQQFWRLVNAGSDTYLDVTVDNTQMKIVGIDGVPLASVGNAPMSVSHYVVPPASRLEFIVTGPPSGKTAYLRTNCFDAGQAGPAMPAATLATINAASSSSDNALHRDRIAVKSALRTARVHGVAFMRNFVRNAGIARTQTLTYSDQNTINGQAYDPSGAPLFYAQSGTMEEWQIVNNSSQVHTFHIHQVHFLVQSIVGGTAIEQNNVGQVIDNVNVPAATANGPGSVKLLMDFTDPTIIGTFLLHCHILSHEDAGMMAKIRVGTAPPMTTNAPQQGLTFASAAALAQAVAVSGGRAPYSVSGCANVANASVSGASISVMPAGAGSCVLTISDASGLSVTVAVTVQGIVSPISLTPNVLAFTAPTAPAQLATISGGTPPYGGSGCQNVASASISGSTLSVAPLGLGSCTLTIADSARNTQTLAVSVNAPSTGSAADNVTFHQNNSRQGWYQAESTLTTASVASSNFGLLGALTAPSGMPAFGKVYSQPLYATSEKVSGTPHNLVIVSTATDQVYAFDDATGAVVWERSFTNPGAGVTQQSWSDTGCSDVNPDIGITGTPVIDRAADRLYVVVPTKENGTFHQRLHAISLQSGNDVVTPVEVSATVALASGGTASIDPKWNFNRSALLEANGNIYVAFGSHCDYNTQATHGWIVAYSAANLAPAGNAVDMTNSNNGGNYFLGSPWMSGYGPAADAQGNVYFATGNGPWDGTSNFSMSVLKLPGNLDISGGSYFTPASEASDSNGDQDLGSGGVMLLPDGISSGFPHLLMQAGKGGATGAQKYLLNRDRLGGMQPGDNGAVWHQNTGGSIWGGPAFFQDTSGNSYVIYGNGAPLNTYQFNPAAASFSVYSSANVGCLECRDSGSQPVVSSNGTNPGTAVVWALKTPGNSGGNISLYAFDALKMTTLFAGTAGTWNQTSGTAWIGGALVSPLVANGRVYVPTDGGVAIFGLRGTAHSMLRLRR